MDGRIDGGGQVLGRPFSKQPFLSLLAFFVKMEQQKRTVTKKKNGGG